MIITAKARKEEGMPVPIGAAGLSMYLVTIVCVNTDKDGWERVDSHEVYVLAGGQGSALAKTGRMISRLQEGFKND